MAEHSNEWYLTGLIRQQPEAVKAIFSEFLPMISTFICQNNGTKEDARDVFMDALEAILRRLQKEDLTLTSSFSTYLFEICKRQWWKKLRRKKFDAGVTPDELAVSDQMQDMDEPLEKTERFKLLLEKLGQIHEDCRQIFDLSWKQDLSMEAVAAHMGWSYAYARKR
ncbi:MAG: sigma-70 family RNA polymerase sigma factor, partial [Saprospiraceae bacterium]|nr:sigma-70 family RNA polymerase sigma factor [Saprospiraceae bacterium]